MLIVPCGLIGTFLQHILKHFIFSLLFPYFYCKMTQTESWLETELNASWKTKKNKSTASRRQFDRTLTTSKTWVSTFQHFVDGVTLTETVVVGEVVQEVITLLSLAPTDWAGAPWSHPGRGIVDIIGSYCTSCRETAHRPQSVLNIHSAFELLHCVHSALLYETLMDTAFPINWLATQAWWYSSSRGEIGCMLTYYL